MQLADLRSLALTYDEVGSTGGTLPAGYRHLRECAAIGHGRQRFEEAGDAVLRWGMQRGAGLKVQSSTPIAAVGSDVLVGIGRLRAPCRVVYVLDEPDHRGFAYGTLAGHPESGEELFAVRYDAASAVVYAEITAFSRPGTWWSRLGSPVAQVAQRVIGRRYLKGV